MKHFIKKKLKERGYKIERPRRKLQGDDVAFLHIGKAAGTQIMHIAENLKPHGVTIVSLGHERKAATIPEGIRYFFSVRHPISRFRSSFYSRLRKGQPRNYNEWSVHEAAAFETFAHANDLAEALFQPGERGFLAAQAMQSIRHTAQQQFDWFTRAAFLSARPPVWIVRQEAFDADMEELLKRLGVDVPLSDLVASDDTAAHKNDYSKAPDLSEQAKENLKRWYARDFVFYDICDDWIKNAR